MGKITETYNPYNQNVERKSSQLPGYINETFINSVEIRSPFIAGNKGYIGGTLQVGQNGIIIDGNTRTISSTNYIENTSGWIIKGNGDSEFNNITVRGNILGGKTSYSDSNDGYYIGKDTDNIYKVNIGNGTNSYLHWDGNNLNIRGNLILPDGTSVEDITVDRSTLSGIPYFMNTNKAPSGSGLKLTSSYLGFYNGSQWETYMDNTGGLYLSGTGSNYLSWNGTILTITGNISASNISGGTIKGATITGGTIQTATSGARIELSSTNGLRSFDYGGNVRLRMPTDGSGMTFFDTSGVSTGRIQGITVSGGTLKGKKVINIDNNGFSGDGNLSVDNILANGGDTYLSIGGTLFTTYCLGKFKIPVGTNLY